MSKVTWILLLVAAAVLIAVAIVILQIPTPITAWLTDVSSAIIARDMTKLSVLTYGVAAGFITSVSGLGAISYAYTKLKGQLQTAKTQLTNVTSQFDDFKWQTTEAKNQIEQQVTGLKSSFASEKEVISKSATDAKTQLSTVQRNYDDAIAKKASVENQLEDYKKKYAKASAQLEVLIPKVP